MSKRSTIAGGILLAACVAAPVLAADPPKPGWSDVAELSYVLTAGNARSNTLGFKNALAYRFDGSAFELKVGAIRAESTTKNPYALPDGTVVENSNSNLTAENYYVKARYDRSISERFLWFVGAAWDRDRFAGIESRWLAEAGVGNVWVNRDDLKFRTGYSVTYTKRTDVTETPGRDTNFAGLRFSWDYLHRFGANTTYTNALTVDDNLKELADFRADMINSVLVDMSKKLALKVSLEFQYANRPAFKTIPVLNPDLTPTGDTTLYRLEKLDTIFTTSLVVNF